MPRDKWQERRAQAANRAVRAQRSGTRLDMIESRIEQEIRAAQERGEFDNLPGYGKPLPKDPGYDLDNGTWMANRVLKEAGFVPDWIELRKEIASERDAVRNALEAYRERARTADRSNPADVADLERLESRYVELATAINAKIDQHNSRCPSSQTLTRFVEDATRRWQ